MKYRSPPPFPFHILPQWSKISTISLQKEHFICVDVFCSFFCFTSRHTIFSPVRFYFIGCVCALHRWFIFAIQQYIKQSKTENATWIGNINIHTRTRTNNDTQFNIQILWRLCGEAKIKVFLIVARINLIFCFSSLLWAFCVCVCLFIYVCAYAHAEARSMRTK